MWRKEICKCYLFEGKPSSPIISMRHTEVSRIAKGVINARVPQTYVFLLDKWMNGLDTLWKAKNQLCSLHSFDSCMVIEEKEFLHDEALATFVDFELANVPYNIRRVRDNEIFNQDIFWFGWHQGHVKPLRWKAMAWSACAHICCVTLSGAWYRHFPKKVDAQEGTTRSDFESDGKEKKNYVLVFELESIPVYYRHAVCN